MALSQIRSELQRTGTSVKLKLSLQPDRGLQRVHVLLQCDNYSDVLATSAQVLCCHGSPSERTLACGLPPHCVRACVEALSSSVL